MILQLAESFREAFASDGFRAGRHSLFGNTWGRVMAFDIRKFAHREYFYLETDSVGIIQCGSLTLGMLSKMQKELKSDNIDSVVFTRNLLHEVGRHAKEDEREEDGKDKNETESSPIADIDISRLSDEEIEVFAREFVAHNDWLLETYKNAQRSVGTNEHGETVVSIQPAAVDLPKEKTERDSDYLVRVLRRHLDEQAERMERALRPFSGALFRNMFSNTTRERFKTHVSLSDQLGRTLRGLGTGLTGKNIGRIANQEYLDIKDPIFREDPVYETNRRLGDVLDHAEELRPIILQSAELFRSMSDTALEMHADFNRSARRSLRVSFLVVCIATVSLAVTAWYSWWSYRQSSVQEAQYQRNLREQEAQFQTLLRQQDNRYRQLLGNQNQQLETLVKRHDAQVERIIESFQASNTIGTENDREQMTEALLKVLQSVQGGQRKLGE